jgi:hypothetical protein
MLFLSVYTYRHTHFDYRVASSLLNTLLELILDRAVLLWHLFPNKRSPQPCKYICRPNREHGTRQRISCGEWLGRTAGSHGPTPGDKVQLTGHLWGTLGTEVRQANFLLGL